MLGAAEFPPELDAYIATMECRIVEELAFVPGSTFYQRVKELGPCSNARDTPAVPNEVQGPNALMVKNVIRRVGRLAQERTTTLCMALCQASGVAGLPAGVKVENGFLKATCALVDSLLYRHFEILYCRHLTVVILGAIFCTASLYLFIPPPLLRFSNDFVAFTAG